MARASSFSRFGTRVAAATVFMLDGEIVEAGPTETIFNNPSDERTEACLSGRFGWPGPAPTMAAFLDS